MFSVAVQSSGGEPSVIEVENGELPVEFLFKSSSRIRARQQHSGGSGQTEETSSQEEPHILKHTVTKPIIQELHEIITPIRNIVQDIRPVEERVVTNVARGNNNNNNNGGGSRGSSRGF